MRYSEHDHEQRHVTRPLTPKQKEELEILIGDATDAMKVLFKAIVRTMDLHRDLEINTAAVAGIFGGVARHIAENINIVELEPPSTLKLLDTPLKVCQAWGARDMGNSMALEAAHSYIMSRINQGLKVDETTTAGAYWRLVERVLPEVSVVSRKHLVKK